jgi:hypothetical protein
MSKEPMAVSEASARCSVQATETHGVPLGYKLTEVGIRPYAK